MSAELNRKIELIMKLLEQTSNKNAVVELLKSKNLSFSGTWPELTEKRVIPAVQDNKLSISELTNLLATSEEHGRQHVFLYKLKPELIDSLTPEALTPILHTLGLDSLLKAPAVLDEPDEPTISDVRWDSDGALTIKVISKRVQREPVDEKLDAEGYIVLRYKPTTSRAVNLVKINPNGLVEVRISSKSNSTRYQEDVNNLLDMLKDIIPSAKLKAHPISLYPSKNNIWERREELSGIIRFSDATLKNDSGYTLRAATPDRESDLLKDSGVRDSMANFKGGNVHCDSNNLFFSQREGYDTPSREVHVLMTGEYNEFAITTHCKSEDYKYVLQRVLEFNE